MQRINRIGNRMNRLWTKKQSGHWNFSKSQHSLDILSYLKNKANKKTTKIDINLRPLCCLPTGAGESMPFRGGLAMPMPGAGIGAVGAMAPPMMMPLLSQTMQVKETLRKYFPETWIWDLVVLEWVVHCLEFKMWILFYDPDVIFIPAPFQFCCTHFWLIFRLIVHFSPI